MTESQKLTRRIREITGWARVAPPRIITDTSDCMRIQRGDVLRIADQDFVITGNKYETRFGIEHQPKYWVFGAVSLASGETKILKTVFDEDFHVHIGVFKIHCYRSPEKEARVLELVRGDDRFMQGYTVYDEVENNVRIIDFIRGPSLFQHIYGYNKPHEEYYHEDLPGILHNLRSSLEAIAVLHDNDTCHGDIRNDHIIIEAGTGKYRWIDFDLNQHVSDFDVWSFGNIINYVVARGIISFSSVFKGHDFSDAVKASLLRDDASAFYEYRVMNLEKLYPYISPRLSHILRHFTTKPESTYMHIRELIDDYSGMLAAGF